MRKNTGVKLFVRTMGVLALLGLGGCSGAVGEVGTGERIEEFRIPVGERIDVGDSFWSDEVVEARPRFGSGNIVQSSNVGADRRSEDRIAVERNDDGLSVHVYDGNGNERLALNAGDAIKTQTVDSGNRYVVQAELDDGSTAHAVIFDIESHGVEVVSGYWIQELDQGDAEVGVFADGPTCDLGGREGRSDIDTFLGDGFGVVSFHRGAGLEDTLLFELEVTRFYANFETGQVNADILDLGSRRRVLLTGEMSADRLIFRGVASIQIDGGVLTEVGRWGGMFCARSSPTPASDGIQRGFQTELEEDAAVFTLAYEYEVEDYQISTMATLQAVREDLVDDPPVDDTGDDDDGLRDDDGTGGDDDGISRDDDDGSSDDDGSGGDDDGFSDDDDDGLGDDDGSGGDDDGFSDDDDDGLGDDDGSGGDDDGSAGDDDGDSEDDDDGDSSDDD